MVRRKKEPPPRRKKGTGSVYQRKSDGRWALEWDDTEGNHYIDYAQTREEATQILDAHIAKIKAGTFVAPDRITVGEWLDEWFANTKSADYRTNTRYNRKTAINARLKKSIGKTEIQRLTSRELQAMLAQWLKDGLKASSIRIYFSPLSMALDSAVKHGIITVNPCKSVELPKRVKSKKAALSLGQAQLFLIEISGHWLEPWVVIAVGTGMRVNELASLKWDDIDFEEHIIHVHRNVTHVEGEFEEGPPKTNAGIRDIAMPKFVEEELTRLWSAQLLKKGELGLGWNKDGLVLPRDDGGYRNADVVNTAFKRKLVQVDLPIITFHGLRHSAFRIMQVLKIPLEVIQKIAGHESISTTADVYGDVSADMQHDAMEKVSEAWKSREKRAN